MKRSAPLARTTSLRRTPLARVSARARQQRGARRRCLDAVRQRSGGRCEAKLAGCVGVAAHGHELLRRSQGGSITDPANVLHCCPVCHRQIHEAPAAAVAAGLLRFKSKGGSQC